MFFLCFGRHHQSDCPSKVKYKKCSGKHATLLHFDTRTSKDNDRTGNSKSNDQASNLFTKLCSSKHSVKNCNKTLLVDLILMSASVKKLRWYAMLDEQSSSTFVDPHSGGVL